MKENHGTNNSFDKPKSILAKWWLAPLVMSGSQALQKFSGYTAWAEANEVAFPLTLLFHMATIGFALSAIVAWHLVRKN